MTINPRQKLFNVRFGGELLYIGPVIGMLGGLEVEPLFVESDAVTDALETQADGVRKASAELVNEHGGTNLYFNLLVYAPEFCADWDSRKEELRSRGEAFDPAFEVEADLTEGSLDALTYIVDEHLPEGWEFTAFSSVEVTLPKKGRAA